MSTNLLLHCGAHSATWEDVTKVETPEPTDTWHPIPHQFLINRVADAMQAANLTVQNMEFGLWKDGMRMFAAFELRNGDNADDYGLVVGLRNSHDKAFSAGLAVGSRVFVCDNLAFSGEITIARKHTRYIRSDLPRLAAQAIGRIGAMRVRQDDRIRAYKQVGIDDRAVHDLLVRSIDAKVIPNARLPRVLQEWREPRHPEFEERNVWSLFNAYTEVFKDTNQLELPRRTVLLHGLMDQASGLVVEGPLVGEGMEDVDVRMN